MRNITKDKTADCCPYCGANVPLFLYKKGFCLHVRKMFKAHEIYSVIFVRQLGFWLQTFHDKQFGDDQHLPFSGLSLVVLRKLWKSSYFYLKCKKKKKNVLMVLVSNIEICNYQPELRGLKRRCLPRKSRPYSFSHDSLTVLWVHLISGTYCTHRITGLIMLRCIFHKCDVI